VRVEPSLFFGDATCPNCGSWLWFRNIPGERIVFDRDASRPIRERVIEFVAAQLNVDREKIAIEGDRIPFADELGADSLDLVELVMELEEELDFA
jgi:acyl carrier protein